MKTFVTILFLIIGAAICHAQTSIDALPAAMTDAYRYQDPAQVQSIINVFPYQQNDPSWSGNTLGNCPPYTIGGYGCAITCVAMLLKTNGVNVNPAQLNTWLVNNGGYTTTCDILWPSVNAYPGTTMSYWQSPSYNLNTIKTEINNGNPVIVSVYALSNSSIHHFIVVKGYNGSGTSASDFVVADPIYPTDQNLASYTLDNGLRIYHNVSGSPSSLMCNNDYACGPPAPLALTINSSCIASSCSTVGATPPSPDIPITCSATYNPSRYDDDVWFSITPTSSSPITIDATPTSNLSNFDLVLAVYHGLCSSPVQDGCADAYYAGVAEQYVLTPVANTTYLIRVFSYGIGASYSGDFDICAHYSSMPDLIITAGSQTASPSTLLAGSSLTAFCSEDNIGTATAGSNVVALWLSADAVLTTSNDVYLGQISGFPSLPAGSNSPTYNSTVTIPCNTAPGNYYLFFWADGNQSISESADNNNFASVTITVNPCITASNNIEDKGSFVSIFPNPSTGEFILESEASSFSGQITITNVIGEIVYSFDMNSKSQSIDFADKPAGIYFVTVRSGTSVTVQRIVINH